MKAYLREAERSLEGFDLETLEKVLFFIREAFSSGGKLLICGNGGSASDASHLAGELVGRFRRERRALPALALTVDPAVLTALSNDYGYDMVFARQVQALGKPGDVLLAVTTSGASPNVVAAALEARRNGIRVAAFTAADRDAPWADVQWKAPSPKTSHAQEAMLVAFHALCEALEGALGKE